MDIHDYAYKDPAETEERIGGILVRHNGLTDDQRRLLEGLDPAGGRLCNIVNDGGSAVLGADATVLNQDDGRIVFAAGSDTRFTTPQGFGEAFTEAWDGFRQRMADADAAVRVIAGYAGVDPGSEDLLISWDTPDQEAAVMGLRAGDRDVVAVYAPGAPDPLRVLVEGEDEELGGAAARHYLIGARDVRAETRYDRAWNQLADGATAPTDRPDLPLDSIGITDRPGLALDPLEVTDTGISAAIKDTGPLASLWDTGVLVEYSPTTGLRISTDNNGVATPSSTRAHRARVTERAADTLRTDPDTLTRALAGLEGALARAHKAATEPTGPSHRELWERAHRPAPPRPDDQARTRTDNPGGPGIHP